MLYRDSNRIGGTMKANVGSKVNTAKCKTINITTPITLEAYVEFIVRDKDGRITQYKRKKAESFVRQFIDLLYVRAADLGNIAGEYWATLDYTNTSRNMYNAGGAILNLAGVATAVTHGIVIGTNSPPAAVEISQYKLVSPIAHATMNYSAVTFGAPADNGATSQFRITRDFANVSGGTVTVEECGLYAYTAAIVNFMIARDLTGGIAVPNGQTLTINYQIQGTVSNYIVRAFIQLLYAMMSAVSGAVYDVDNTARTIATQSYPTLYMRSQVGLAQDLFNTSGGYQGIFTGNKLGIQVGSGVGAVASSDYKLATRIPHGITSGAALLYAGTEVDIPVVSAPTANFKIRRYFYNGSGATVTVREAGVNSIGHLSSGSYTPYLFLIARKLTGDVAVLDTELLKVEWTFQVST
jgi:tetrahydromethanopterin S-methyltransferase subunit B